MKKLLICLLMLTTGLLTQAQQTEFEVSDSGSVYPCFIIQSTAGKRFYITIGEDGRLKATEGGVTVQHGESIIWLDTPVNKISGTPATVFTDIDISGDTGADIAHTAIFSVKIIKSVADAHRDVFMRKNGLTLTDNNIPAVGSEVKTGSHIHGQLHVPLDSNEICEYKANANGDTTVDITLLGYIK